MANKHDVLRLLEQGLTTRQIADRLGCLTAYVRATRARATPKGAASCRIYSKWRYATNPEYREQKRASARRLCAEKSMRRDPELVE